VTYGRRSDETGIVVIGIDQNRHGYVIADYSMKGSPNDWAKRVVRAYDDHDANLVVAEKNQGGDMVRDTMTNVRKDLPIKLVHASKGKVARAEPVAALYEQGKIHHVGVFPRLEDQMCTFIPDEVDNKKGTSPNRVDALVWAFTESLVKGKRGGTWGRRLRAKVA